MLILIHALLLVSVASGGETVAIRVKRAETIANGPIEHATILVEDGKITAIGAYLPVERGIRVLEREDWVAMPGLVNAHTRAGGERAADRLYEPQSRASFALDPRADLWEELLELGVTTLGVYPDGSGVPGQAVVVRPRGKTVAEMLVAESAYLKIFLLASASSKKVVRDAFDKADEHEEKVEKEREKWEKEQEKKKKSSKSSSKKEDKKEDEKKTEDKEKDAEEEAKEPPKDGPLAPEDEKDEEKSKKDDSGFVPPAPEAKVAPFLALRAQELTAMMSIRKAADYLHLLDVLEDEEEVRWFVEFPLRHDIDLYEVTKQIGERKLAVVTVPEITLQTNSLRERNVPAELVRAGAKLVLTPRSDTLDGHRDWLPDVGRLVGLGLPRESALAAVTLEAARVLGVDAQLGSLEEEKVANIVFWSGDPLEPASRVEAVMLDGEFVKEPK